MKRHHVTWGGIVAIVACGVLILALSDAVHEYCQKRERQFGGAVWGQHAFAEKPSVWNCWERVKPW